MHKAPCTLDQPTRELLTRAASAAGIRIQEWVGDQANVIMPDGNHCGWNPLASWGGGDALRLAVAMDIDLYAACTQGYVRAIPRADISIEEPVNGDKLAATCRAIVRAAAALAPSNVGGLDA